MTADPVSVGAATSAGTPTKKESYVRPFVYLYGTKDKEGWRAQLSIVEFVRGAASAFTRQ
jgi:hypothetical protein